MARAKKMSKEMQAAAVRSALSEGKTLTEIEKDYPELADGLALVKKQDSPASPPPTRRGSGNKSSRSSMTRRPQL